MAKRIYVGNLPFSASDEEIRSLFAEYGSVNSVSPITKEAGDKSSACLVEMKNERDVPKAVKALDHQEFKGRKLNVRVKDVSQSQMGGRSLNV